MRLIDFLKQHDYIVEYNTRFFVTREGSINNGSDGPNQPFYCHLREQKTTNTIDHFKNGMQGSITGNGDTIMQATMNLILKLEKIGQEEGIIGTRENRHKTYVTRLDTIGIVWP